MGIIKHVANNNARISDALRYLTMQHDEETHKPILDKDGEMIEREEYLIDGINCTPEDFDALCYQDSIRYKANRKASDIKTHQYIISFDPKDRAAGLTPEIAQEYGMYFAARYFPGHRILVCTHPDGSSGSGNIHIHIVISALRFEDRPRCPEYMKLDKHGNVKTSEYRAGCKHQDTAPLRSYLFDRVQDFCREHGYAISPKHAAKKCTNQEYVATVKGQRQLDEDNRIRRQKGQTPVQNKFQSKMDDLRNVIADAVSRATSWEEFSALLQTHYTRQVEHHPGLTPMAYAQLVELRERLRQAKAQEVIMAKHQKIRLDLQRDQIKQGLNDTGKPSSLDTWCDLGAHLTAFLDRDDSITVTHSDIYAMESHALEQLESRKKTWCLYLDVCHTYETAANIALAHGMGHEARSCTLLLEEMLRRYEGYWISGDLNSARETRLNPETGIECFVRWYDIDQSALDDAQARLDRIKATASHLEAAITQPEIQELPFPIEVKITRGAISYKHPDMARWVRGKTLGTDYELDTIAAQLEENRKALEARTLPGQHIR